MPAARPAQPTSPAPCLPQGWTASGSAARVKPVRSPLSEHIIRNLEEASNALQPPKSRDRALGTTPPARKD